MKMSDVGAVVLPLLTQSFDASNVKRRSSERHYCTAIICQCSATCGYPVVNGGDPRIEGAA